MELSQSQSATPGSPTGRIRQLDLRYWAYRDYYTSNYRISYNNFNEDDTYVCILNIASDYFDSGEGVNKQLYELMKKDPHIKIVWESEMAVNRRPGHGTKPRNKMIVFEYVKNPEVLT